MLRHLSGPLPRPLALPALATGRAADRLLRWAHDSQQGARRNAMLASTALAQRRAELQEVEEYLASLQVGRHVEERIAGSPERSAHG